MKPASSPNRHRLVLVVLLLGAAWLAAARAPAADVLVPTGAVWKFLDDGSNQGAAWRSNNFDDATWRSGPAQLGYGDGDEATVVGFGPDGNNKYVTTYFRRLFPVTNAVLVTNLTVRLLRDDGGVVYLNGVEIFRSNMTGGTINYTTLASSTVNGAAEGVFSVTAFRPTNLIEGTNLLAVEIHQSELDSSDISFALELLADALPRAPTILVQPADQTVTEGYSAFFGVEVGGVPPLLYQWEFNGEAIPDATNATLIATQLTMEESGDLRVVVQNAFGSATSRTARLTVNPFRPAPVITSFVPPSGPTGSLVIISGNNFRSTPAENVVYFGAVTGAVVGASPTVLLTPVPVGASFTPLAVTSGGLTAQANAPFAVRFSSANLIDTNTFTSNATFNASSSMQHLIAADMDGDGRADLVVTGTGSDRVSIYRNQATPGALGTNSLAARVQFVTGDNPYQIAVGDLDGDGKPDLAIVNSQSSTLSLFRNLSVRGAINSNSLAAKVDFATGTRPQGVVIRDFDRDGKPDVVVANYTSRTLSVFRNTSASGPFTPATLTLAAELLTSNSPNTVVAADFDGDGWPDLAVANEGASSVSVFRNLGASNGITAASFTARIDLPTAFTPRSIAAGDLDGDGRPDLAVANYSTPSTVSLIRNVAAPGALTTNSFAPRVNLAALSFVSFVTVGDLDGDGRPDLAAGYDSGSAISLFRNQVLPGGFTSNSFSARIDLTNLYSFNRSIAINDLDNDGKPDLTAGSWGSGVFTLLRNVIGGPIPPRILAPPQSQTVAEGNPLILAATLNGSVPLFFQWQFNGMDIPGATNETFAIASVSTNDAGNYRVIVTNALGSAISDTARVKVLGIGADLFDDFEPGIDLAQWSAFGATVAATNFGGFISPPNALWFGGDGSRFAATRSLDTRRGGRIAFNLRLADSFSVPNWEYADLPSRGVVLEFSVDGGGSWTNFATFDRAEFRQWTSQQLLIPPAARALGARFRWRQLVNSGNCCDHWALDDVLIALGPVVPVFTNAPTGQVVAPGANVTFNAGALGDEPLFYQWQFNGADLPGETNATLRLTVVTPAHGGDYTVRVRNEAGETTSDPAVLTVYLFSGGEFKITSLTSNHSVAVGHGDITSFALGGLAATPAAVFVAGAASAARFAQADLSDGRALNRRYEGIVSNLRTERAYALGDGTNLFSSSTRRLSSLLELDGVTGLLTTNRILFMRPIFLTNSYGSAGIFSGYDRLVVHDGVTVFSVELPSGLVVELGNMTPPPHNFPNSLVYFGVAEFFDGALHVVNGRDFTTVARTRVPDGFTTNVATFARLGDVASLTASIYSGRWFFELDAASQWRDGNYTVGFADATFQFPDTLQRPEITGGPTDLTVNAGAAAAFSIAATGSRPLTYEWRFNGAVLAGATNATLTLDPVTVGDAGVYSFLVSNAAGVAQGRSVRLNVVVLDGEPFQITSLTTNNALAIERATETGDDRGGIAVSDSQVFVVGDSAAVRYNLADLSHGTRLTGSYDALVCDLRSEKTYSLGNGTNFLNYGGGMITNLIELDSATGVRTGHRIDLVPPIAFTNAGGGQPGIFSGYGRIVLHNGARAWQIQLPSGAVTDLGAMPEPAHNFSESWAYWGVAEFFSNALHLVCAANSSTITRTRVPDGLVTPLLTVSSGLGDMASLTVSPANERWYFAYEGNGFIRNGDETLGSADATFNVAAPPRPPSIVSQPQSAQALEGFGAAFSVGVLGTRPLFYQWYFNGAAIAGATNFQLRLTGLTLNDSGAYSVVVSNQFGVVPSETASLNVREGLPLAKEFRLGVLSTNGCQVVDHNAITGDDRGGIAVSPTHVFYSGDNFTGRFLASDLSGGTNVGRVLDGLVSNLRTETIYSLANGTNLIGSSGGAVNALLELDGATGVTTGNRIDLSVPITMNYGSGIFSGYDRLVLHNGTRAYAVELPLGEVIDFGPMPAITHSDCENWAHWGVAEQFQRVIWLVYAQDFNTIARTRVPDGLTTSAGEFNSLSDLCSFTVSPSRNRWYFHYEGSAQFGGTSETIGFCDVSWDNAPPVLGAIADATTLEDTPVTVTLDVSDAHTPLANLVLTARSSNTNLVPLANLIFAGSGATRTLTILPATNASGSAAITVTLTDAGGFTAPRTFAVAVAPVNDPPSFVKGPDQVLDENGGPRIIRGWATGLSRGPANEAGQTLRFFVSHDSPALFAAPPAIDYTGTLTYTPAANAYGSATVTVVLRDNGGTANGGVDASAPQTFTITVNAVNHAPSFSKGPKLIASEDAGPQSVPGWATGIRAGPANESGQALTFLVSHDNPALFSTPPSVAPDGTLTFTPAPDAHGWAMLTAVLRDDGGTARGGADTSAPQTFSITVSSVNDAPSFVKGPNQSVAQDAGPQTVPGWATGIRAGPPNESGQTLSFQVNNDRNSLFATPPSLAPNGTLTYAPATNANGTATITVVLRDNGGTVGGGVDASPAQPFTISVRAVNHPPVAHAQSLSLNEDTARAVHLTASDADGDTLTYAIVTAPAHGTLAGDGANRTYTPATNYHGADSFTFQVNDGQADSAPATITLTIVSANRPPVADASATKPQFISPNNSNALVVLDGSRSSDADSDPLRFDWLAAGSVVPFATGVVTTNRLEVGAHALTLLVDDGAGSDTDAVTVEVITLDEAVADLIVLLDQSGLARKTKRSLSATLQQAAESFDRGKFDSGADRLDHFQKKVRSQVADSDPALAGQLIGAAQQILDALAGPWPPED